MGGGTGDAGPNPLLYHKNIRILGNFDPGLLKNYKSAKPTFNVGPSSTRQWRFAGGPMMARLKWH